MELQVKLQKLRPNAVIPAYATPGSAAVDLCAALEADVEIPPRERRAIPTGLAMDPGRDDVVALVYARSGLGCKHGIVPANCVGVVDSDYRGEILVCLQNNSDVPYTVRPGDRIAQLLFTPVCHASFTVEDSLSATERGQGGFGSTGK